MYMYGLHRSDGSESNFIDDADIATADVSAYMTADRDAFSENTGPDGTPRGTVRQRGHGSSRPDTKPSAPYPPHTTTDGGDIQLHDGGDSQSHDGRSVAQRLDRGDAAMDDNTAAWNTQGYEHTEDFARATHNIGTDRRRVRRQDGARHRLRAVTRPNGQHRTRGAGKQLGRGG